MYDCYEILKVNKNFIIQQEMDEAQTNAYIKECYDETIRTEVEIPRQVAMMKKDKEELEKLKQVEKICKDAYEQIATAEGRRAYEETEILNEKARFERIKNATTQEKFKNIKKQHDQIIEKANAQQEEENKYAKFKEKYQQKVERTAYGNLNAPLERLHKLVPEQADQIIEKKRDLFLKQFEKEFKETNHIITKGGIALKINAVKKAYEEIATEEKRKEYEKQTEKKRKQQIKEKYDHTKEYNPNLIRTSQGKEESLSNKKVVKMPEPSRVMNFTDKEGRKLLIRKTAVIGFLDATSPEIRKVYEYEVKRQIGKETKTDIIYTDISVTDLDFERDLSNFDKNYYDCVVNELFTEEMIEASKYNEGYIGRIEKDSQGNYQATLGQEQLSIKEQKILTAIMIQKQKEKEEERGER